LSVIGDNSVDTIVSGLPVAAAAPLLDELADGEELEELQAAAPMMTTVAAARL
jgi:hypothetical protein